MKTIGTIVLLFITMAYKFFFFQKQVMQLMCRFFSSYCIIIFISFKNLKILFYYWHGYIQQVQFFKCQHLHLFSGSYYFLSHFIITEDTLILQRRIIKKLFSLGIMYDRYYTTYLSPARGNEGSYQQTATLQLDPIFLYFQDAACKISGHPNTRHPWMLKSRSIWGLEDQQTSSEDGVGIWF